MYKFDFLIMDALHDPGEVLPVEPETTRIFIRGKQIGSVPDTRINEVKEVCFCGFFHLPEVKMFEVFTPENNAFITLEILRNVNDLITV